MKNPITSSICCDIIVTLTNYKRFIYLIQKAGETPQWLRHSFIFILDGIGEKEEQEMHDWYYGLRGKQALPNAIVLKGRKDLWGNQAGLYDSGLMASDNPFVYFQSEKDELPVNIDKSINYLYKNPDYYAVIGKCETFLEDGTLIESFPGTNIDNEFLYDCEEAIKLFPSYLHPLSSVIRKELFTKVPYWDMDKNFNEFAYYYFVLRAVYSKNVKIDYVPYTIKVSNRQREHAIVIGPKLRARLIHDIRLWVDEFGENEYTEFQHDILQLLEEGAITTFKEIDARIEDYLDSRR